MAGRFDKLVQSNGTWRLLDTQTGESIGRIWSAAHVDRIIRDANLAAAIQTALGQAGAARRTAARTALADWQTAGGHAVDFAALTLSPNNDAGGADGNTHLYIAGAELGYLHGIDSARDVRLARFARLAEEAFSAESLGTTAAKNTALDAALTRFRDNDGAN